MIWLSLAVLSAIVALFAWCACTVAGSADDDAVALAQLSERNPQQRVSQNNGEGWGDIGAVHHGEAGK